MDVNLDIHNASSPFERRCHWFNSSCANLPRYLMSMPCLIDYFTG